MNIDELVFEDWLTKFTLLRYKKISSTDLQRIKDLCKKVYEECLEEEKRRKK